MLKLPYLCATHDRSAGLDVSSRPKLLRLLHKIHPTQKPRTMLGLRTQDDIPEWVTHPALVQDGTINAGESAAIVPFIYASVALHGFISPNQQYRWTPSS
ncbi:hypothetical protein AN958_00143 [Leucoagaricus sp. SymC.cos]|nr:hypothetical protein AN958_00143 [Leucoagaricus sp. SymC.cos]